MKIKAYFNQEQSIRTLISITAISGFILGRSIIGLCADTISSGELRKPSASASVGDKIADELKKASSGIEKADLSQRIIVSFKEVGREDVAIAGGKGANLGEMQRVKGVSVPPGVAVTTKGFRLHIDKGITREGITLREFIKSRLTGLDYDDSMALEEVGGAIRNAIQAAKMPEEVEQEIRQWYQRLCDEAGVKDLPVAIRSSATAEDMAEASFAGQQDTYLNIRGIDDVLDAVKRNWASLFTDRAIFYRQEHNIDHGQAYISVVIQRMVESKVAGVAFSVHTDTGFPVIFINAAPGLGEGVVAGMTNPDSFTVKRGNDGRFRIVRREFGSKLKKVIYRKERGLKAKEGTEVIDTNYEERHNWSLTDEQVIQLAENTYTIHSHYGKYTDTEWAFDDKGKLWTLQARPETVWNQIEQENPEMLKISKTVISDEDVAKARVLLSGVSGSRAATGKVVFVDSKKEGRELAEELSKVKEGDILVTEMTKPDMGPAMKRAGAIITNEGGPTCHAAIIAREMKKPCVVGTGNATDILEAGQVVTVDANRGKVYEGALEIFKMEETIDIPNLPLIKTKVGTIIASPFLAMEMWKLSKYSKYYGIGLLRKEFTDTTELLAHPLFGLAYDMYNDPNFKDEAQRKWIKDNIMDNEERKNALEELIKGYPNFAEFYKDRLANAIALIAAVQVNGQRVKFRTTDFKTNEYRNQLGGLLYEPKEKNPMMGYRGINRMLSEAYSRAFELEIEAIKKARDIQKNIDVMFPVVRTPQELKRAIALFASHGLVRGQDGFQIGMMAEVPANIFQAKEFFKYVDFVSIGSNDLTQFTLALGRDNDKMKPIFNETNPAVRKALEIVIKTAKKSGVMSGLCGQRPSNDPEFAKLLVGFGIDSVSVTPDAFNKVVAAVAQAEKELEANNGVNPQISGWVIPENEASPERVAAVEVSAADIIKDIGVHPMVLLSDKKSETKDLVVLLGHDKGEIKKAVFEGLFNKSAKEYVINKVYSAIMEKAKSAPSGMPVIYATDDLDKTDYEKLNSDKKYELFDENPQLGFCGLVRVVDPDYSEFFRWQLEGIKKAKQALNREVGIKLNLARTLDETKKAMEIIKGVGGEDWLLVGMEIAGPANVLLVDEFIKQGMDFLSENNERFLSYTLAVDPGNPYIKISDKEKEEALSISRRIWTHAATRHHIPLIQGRTRISPEIKAVRSSATLDDLPKTSSAFGDKAGVAVELVPGLFEFQEATYKINNSMRGELFDEYLSHIRNVLEPGVREISRALIKAAVVSDSRGTLAVEVSLRVGDMETTGSEDPLKEAGNVMLVDAEEAVDTINNVIPGILEKSGLNLNNPEDLIKAQALIKEKAGRNYEAWGANVVIPVSEALLKMAEAQRSYINNRKRVMIIGPDMFKMPGMLLPLKKMASMDNLTVALYGRQAEEYRKMLPGQENVVTGDTLEGLLERLKEMGFPEGNILNLAYASDELTKGRHYPDLSKEEKALQVKELVVITEPYSMPGNVVVAKAIKDLYSNVEGVNKAFEGYYNGIEGEVIPRDDSQRKQMLAELEEATFSLINITLTQQKAKEIEKEVEIVTKFMDQV